MSSQAGVLACVGLGATTRTLSGTTIILPGLSVSVTMTTSSPHILYNRRMPLVPKMIRELVFALPPLGEARVLDLLCRKSDFFILNVFSSILAGSGACSVAVKKAYPRCRLTILDKSQFRLEQCRRQLEAVDTNFTVESEYNTEVCQCFKSVGFLLSTFS